MGRHKKSIPSEQEITPVLQFPELSILDALFKAVLFEIDRNRPHRPDLAIYIDDLSFNQLCSSPAFRNYYFGIYAHLSENTPEFMNYPIYRVNNFPVYPKPFIKIYV